MTNINVLIKGEMPWSWFFLVQIHCWGWGKVTGQRTESDQKCRKSIAEEVGTKFVQSVYWLETFKSLWCS